MIQSRARQRGSQIIEAPLTLSLFFWVTFGLFDFAWVMFLEQTLTHQVRSAARYGAVHAYEPDATLLPEVKNIAVCGNASSCTGAYGFTPSQVTVTCLGTATPAGGTECQQRQDTDGRIVVTLPGVSYIPLAPGATHLNGRPISVSIPIENTTGAVN